MWIDGTGLVSGHGTTARGGQGVRRLAVALTVIATVVSLFACASTTGAPKGAWRANYFVNPDRVWNAIEGSLLDAHYTIIEENRFDGTIRAESAAEKDGTVVVLDINQVVYTNDQVNVYVRPSFAEGATSADAQLLKTAGDQFMAILNAKLKP